MMRPDINYYALLDICSTATEEDIKQAYRKKILEVHVDKRPGDDSDICYKVIEANRVLSNRKLRAKYDIQRVSPHNDKFVPAGYICYQVGENQMSKRILQNISAWKKEFDKHNSNGGYSDNYFECFSYLLSQVLEPEEDAAACHSSCPELNGKSVRFCCKICDGHFPTKEMHWDHVLHPYLSLFYSPKAGLESIYDYFESILGSKEFRWTPVRFPFRLLGIWDAEDWKELEKVDEIVLELLDQIPLEQELSPEEIVEFVTETFLSEDQTNEEIPSDLCRLFNFIVEKQDEQELVEEKLNNLLMEDNVTHILYMASIMKNYLDCGPQVWTLLASDALEADQTELAMLWTKIGVEFGQLEKSEWKKLGLKIQSVDPLLAHFCFLFAGYKSDAQWKSLAESFAQDSEHFNCMAYLVAKGGPITLLQKSRKLPKKSAEATLYENVYYSLRVKFLLSKILEKKTGENWNPIEEVVDVIQEIGNNPLEGIQLIASTWPNVFESPVICVKLHRAMVHIFRKNRLNFQSFKNILGAYHFLPENQTVQEVEILFQDLTRLISSKMEKSLETSDFGCLTEALVHITPKCIQAALTMLQDMEATLETNSSSHLKAMRFLIKGTVYKISGDVMGALSEYQAALLCSPECMQRILPSISELSQDINFHEEILSAVQTEVKELKKTFDAEEYPEVESYADKRKSLVITHVAPPVDFGYKDAISKIQQVPQEENPLPPPENVEAPPVEANSPLVTLNKNEQAIESGGGQMGELNAALAYIDLLKAIPVPFQPGPIVMASSHFLKAMNETTDVGSLFGYRNAILLLAENLLRIDKKTQMSIQHCLTHKQMLSILLSAHEKLSKAMSIAQKRKESSESSSDDSCSDDDSSTESDQDSTPKSIVGPDLIKMSEANLISKLLKNVVNIPKITPLANMPTLNCSDLIYVETVSNNFLSHFCSQKVSRKDQSPKIPKHLHAYTHFVEVWKGRSLLIDFETARLRAMEELLASRGWSLRDVENLMGVPMLKLSDNGWTNEYKTQLVFPNDSKAFQNISGFKIDMDTGDISFLLSKDDGFSYGNVFDVEDLLEIFSNGLTESTLRLESPDHTSTSHPFKQVKYDPTHNCYAPKYFQTLSRVTMLLCYLSSGLEISAKAPFSMKRTYEGLLRRFESEGHLQHFLRPVSVRKRENGASKVIQDQELRNRFWLDVVELFEEEEKDQGAWTYNVGQVTARVKVNTLVMARNGTKSHFAPEFEFAKDLTQNFDEIGEYFPEFLRVKELAKISAICSKLKTILKDNQLEMDKDGQSEQEISRLSRVSAAIRSVGISLGNEENKFKAINGKNGLNLSESLTCSWLPAAFCNNLEPETYEVTAGVNMSPIVTYGPVSVSRESFYVPASQIFKKY